MRILIFAAVLCLVHCGPFTVKISTKGEYKVGEDISCDVTITNTYNKDYSLLARNTPLEGLKSAIFSVSKNGKVLPYDGMLLKRGPPSNKEYVLARAESSLLSSVDLSRVFSFESTGEYHVQLEMRLQFSEDNTANISTQLVYSNMKMFTLIESEDEPKLTEGELIRQNTTRTLAASPQRTEAAISPSFAGSGTSSDRSTGTVAYNVAYSILYKCSQSVTGNPSLYKKWFGTAYSGYTKTVQGNYLNIKSAMESYRFTLYFHGPECAPGVVAYTYHGSTTLYLCDVYFRVPTTGSDSKMGTIVHEMSHAVAFTADIRYGTRDCLALAATSPAQAITNADNYEYFAEALY